MLTKQYAFEVKGAEAGIVSGLASVFGNVDSDGEVVDKGAFADFLKGAASVPVLWQHQKDEPIGWSTLLLETAVGLQVAAKLMTDTERGRHAYSFVKEGLRLGASPGLSIGFCVPEGGAYFKDGVRHFSRIDLKEFSIVTFPANPAAVATSTKNRGPQATQEPNHEEWLAIMERAYELEGSL